MKTWELVLGIVILIIAWVLLMGFLLNIISKNKIIQKVPAYIEHKLDEGMK